ncbi:PREDICTED: putative cell wall protein [Camelina sativa]|uniref:Cell wall protein n=1 Tax=Camelina sativa TaxID=90675 RepID=A0ABM0UAZ2_CAMSA|nr:PREDICTED: putative cell wall protein [Camelina sativa]
MAYTLKTLTATIVLVSLLLGSTEQVSGTRYISNSPAPSESKHSDFLVNMVPQPSGIVPGFGRFLLPPTPKLPFLPYKDPLAAAPVTSYPTPPSRFASNTGYKSRSPSSIEDQVPPVPQP